METCYFCNKIYNEDELNGQYCREVCDCITYDENNNNYNFWHECDDDYYTGNIMECQDVQMNVLYQEWNVVAIGFVVNIDLSVM